ncbi:MAG: nitrate reductase cytochrome c-type subunit [Bacteroidales bacterium]|nr:nitrate reductase cytochrome c-type subunit [Bacteroidales bacterium]
MKKIHYFSLFAALLLFSCGETTKQEVTVVTQDPIASQVGGLLDDDQGLAGMPVYSDAAPGTSEKFDRSFENAPPLIPHNTEGLVPIKKDNNMCLTCHMPAVAVAMKSTALPASHFTDYRPKVIEKGGKYQVDAKEGEVYEKSLGDELSSTRYNCTQCHVSQAKIDPWVQNNFEQVFRDNNLKTSSNLEKNIQDGVK